MRNTKWSIHLMNKGFPFSFDTAKAIHFIRSINIKLKPHLASDGEAAILDISSFCIKSFFALNWNFDDRCTPKIVTLVTLLPNLFSVFSFSFFLLLCDKNSTTFVWTMKRFDMQMNEQEEQSKEMERFK